MIINGDEIALGQGLSIIFFEINNKNPAPYNQTVFWINAQYYLKFIKDEKDGRKETLIPGRGKLEEFKESFNNLKRKLEENEPLLKNDFKFLPILPEFKSALESSSNEPSQRFIGSNSSQNLFLSISSQSTNENEKVHQEEKKKTSLLPRRSSSVLSNKSISSGSSSSLSSTPSRIPILKGSFLSKIEVFNTENRYKINKAESWILISPELLDLVKAKKLIEDTDSRKADALTYRNTDKVRLMNLNKNEISILEEKLPEFCKELESKERINIFGN